MGLRLQFRAETGEGSSEGWGVGGEFVQAQKVEVYFAYHLFAYLFLPPVKQALTNVILGGKTQDTW